jgi:colanic acid/amylovoran biosynthesis glycosyltransferase
MMPEIYRIDPTDQKDQLNQKSQKNQTTRTAQTDLRDPKDLKDQKDLKEQRSQKGKVVRSDTTAELPGTKPGKLGTVVVFRIQLLPPSETFIVAQASAMRRFAPFFVGWRKMTGIAMPRDITWTVDDGGFRGRLRELRFRYAGPTRQELARLRAQAPRLLYAHFAPDAYAAMELAEGLGVPLVTALHGYDVTMSDEAIASTRLGREYLEGRRALQKKGALFLACSAYIRNRGLEMGFPPERTIVHSIGVDIERFKPPFADERRGKIVLFVGRLVEKKGCGCLIEAMAEVERRCPAAELVVIGDGPLRRQYEVQAAARGVRCRFFGSQPASVVRDWMARSTVFCVPSVIAASGDAEGFGMVFIEAQAMGLPVVSTLSGGIPEAVRNGETGLLVKERDPAALTRAILRLIEDHHLWREFSIAGRKRVVTQFNLAQQTHRLENLFEQLLPAR